MFRKRILTVFIVALALSLSLAACSSKDSKNSSSSESTSASSNSSNSSTNSEKLFKNDVEKVCNSVDRNVFDELQNSVTSFESDPEAYKKAFQDGEDELDKAIAKLDDINPPSKWEDDWETLIDDFSAIRDSYPDFNDALADLLRITSQAKGSTSAATLTQLQAEAEKVQAKIEALAEDLNQRSTEIGDIVDRLGISDCVFD